MAQEKALGGKQLATFFLYLAIIALCVAVLFYILLNAKPSITPKVRDTGHPSAMATPKAASPKAALVTMVHKAPCRDGLYG